MTAGGRKSPWFLRLARRYAARRLARGLDGLHVAGLEAARAEAARRPLILAANHVGWWDTFVLVALDGAMGTDAYALMDADGIRRLPFFARLGALPMERGGTASRAALREAASLLDRPRRTMWIFPQGRHRAPHLRPLAFARGVELLARLAPDAAVVPVALQYVWRDAPAPAAYAHLGAALETGADVAALEAAVAAGLAAIDRAGEGDAGAFVPLVPSRISRPDAGMGARMLGTRADREGARG